MTRPRWVCGPRVGRQPGSPDGIGLRRRGSGARKLGAAGLAAVTAIGLMLTPTSATAAAKSAATALAETALGETGWTATASTNSAAGDAPANAIDGNLATRYSSDAVQAAGMWFQVNLGSSQSFNQIEMNSSNWPGDYAVGYNVEVSTNGSTFTSVATGTGSSAVETVTFTAQTAQYIRVVLTAASTGPWWSIGEFTAYTNGSGSGSGGEAPYGGTAAAVPGTVQAENYDTGGQGVAYNVTGVNGSANSYRTDGVDLEATSDTGGGDDIGWTAAGQWFKYTVNVATAGTYTVGLRVAAPGAITDALHVTDASGTNLSGNVSVPATGGYQTWTTVNATVTLPAGTQTLTVNQDGAGWNINYLTFATSGGGGTPPPTGGSLGSNVIVFTPSESEATIQSELNTLGTQQNPNQFGTQRYELLFEPGTYGTAASPLDFQVGYYEAVAGLGQNPSQTVINGTIDSYNQCPGGVQTNCNATDNFWRSITNLTINVAGLTGCFAGDEVWAASQASPMRRVQVNGNMTLMDFCDGSPDYASGGFIADSQLNGAVTNGSQQQYVVRNSSMNSWSNGVWNQVFCGDPGAPAQSFASNSGDSGGPNPYTTLSTCPTTQEAPYLYQDSSGNYNVFVPSLRTNSSGASWAGGNTPGTSLSVNNTFYVVNSASTITQINAALAAGDNLLFTPGVYSYASTINVTRADTKIIGLGFATLIPTAGQTTINVADVGGVNITGLILDAGPVNSPTLLTVGTQGSNVSHAADPVTIDDVFFRVGGEEAGSVTDAFVDNSNNSILDDIWSWRADHGAGAGSWAGDTAATGLTVNGNNVTAYGLAVEHYQQYETVWNGQGGTVIFFQNENPYEVPNQASWMSSSTQDGYPAFYVPNSVTTFQGYGMGSYSYFDQGVAIENAMAFQAPNTSGVQFHDLMTVFLNGSGGIQSVIDGTGAAVSPTFGGPSDVVSY